jgi:hypothetical protein
VGCSSLAMGPLCRVSSQINPVLAFELSSSLFYASYILTTSNFHFESGIKIIYIKAYKQGTGGLHL